MSSGVDIDIITDPDNVQTYDVTTPDPSQFACHSCEQEPNNDECDFNQVEVCPDSKQVRISVKHDWGIN